MNLATVGTNWITSSFIEAAKQSGALHLTAVYSRTVEKAQQFAGVHGAERYFTDLGAMADSDNVDCVYIASPNALHYEQAILFLQHGKHVICEKPIFSNVEKLEAAYEVAEAQGVYLFEAMRNIHMPNFYQLKKHLPVIGKRRSATLNYMKYSSRYDLVLNGEEPNIFSLDYAGGALVDLGVYPLALAVALFGKPESTCYFPVKIRTAVDGSGTLVLNYPDFTCNIMCSKITTSYVNSEIHGEKGSLSIGDIGALSDVALHDIHSGMQEVIGDTQLKAEMFYEIEAFATIMKSGDQAAYERLKALSHDVLSITETTRKQNGILFPGEK